MGTVPGINLVRSLLLACQEARRITELQPPLPDGLTPANLKVLNALYDFASSGRSAKVSDISSLLKVTRPGITRLVSELEAIGAVEKYADAKDKRVVRLKLLPYGRKLYRYHIEEFHHALAKELAGLTDAEVAVTRSTIEKLFKAMAAAKAAHLEHIEALKEAGKHG